MKKLVGILFGILFVSSSYTLADCLEVEFDNGDSLCIGMKKDGKEYTPYLEKKDLVSHAALRCEFEIDENEDDFRTSVMYDLGAATESFKFSSKKTLPIKMAVRYNNTYYTIVKSEFDFDDLTWGKSSRDNDDRDDDDDEDIDVSTDDKTIDTGEWADISVKMGSTSYKGDLEFTVKYDGSTISTSKFDTYFEDYDDDLEDGYEMSSADKGKYSSSKFIKFKKKGEYELIVKDKNGNKDSIIFKVSESDDDDDDNNKNSKLTIEVDDSSVDTKDDIKITVTTDKDYRKTLEFRGQYRSSSSSSWKKISSNNDSDYYDTRSSYWKNGYTMDSSDKGEVVFKNFLSFKKSGEYKIEVEDYYGETDYVIIKVGDDDDEEYDDIDVSTNKKKIDTGTWANISIKMSSSSYKGDLDFTIKYEGSKISTSKFDTYFSDYDDDLEDGYEMSSADKGKYSSSKFIKFKKKGKYQFFVEDKNGNKGSITFTVGENDDDEESSVDGFTKGELRKAEAIYDMWDDLVDEILDDSPSLKRNTKWNDMKDEIEQNLKDVIKDKSKREYDDFDDMKDALIDWIRYTQKYS